MILSLFKIWTRISMSLDCCAQQKFDLVFVSSCVELIVFILFCSMWLCVTPLFNSPALSRAGQDYLKPIIVKSLWDTQFQSICCLCDYSATIVRLFTNFHALGDNYSAVHNTTAQEVIILQHGTDSSHCVLSALHQRHGWYFLVILVGLVCFVIS